MRTKIICGIICLMVALFATSCGRDNEEIHKDETTEKIIETTENSTNADNKNTFDFKGVPTTKVIVLEIGEKREIDGSIVAIENDSINCNESTLTAKNSGVCRVAVDVGSTEVYVVCVLKEGTFRDPSAGSPTVQRIGTSLGFPGGAYDAEYFSSDESVATVDEKGEITFVGEGYVVITSAGVSVPIVTSFVAIDAE